MSLHKPYELSRNSPISRKTALSISFVPQIAQNRSGFINQDDQVIPDRSYFSALRNLKRNGTLKLPLEGSSHGTYLAHGTILKHTQTYRGTHNGNGQKSYIGTRGGEPKRDCGTRLTLMGSSVDILNCAKQLGLPINETSHKSNQE